MDEGEEGIPGLSFIGQGSGNGGDRACGFYGGGCAFRRNRARREDRARMEAAGRREVVAHVFTRKGEEKWWRLTQGGRKGKEKKG